MVINLRRIRRWRADTSGLRWPIYDRRDAERTRYARCFLNGQEVTKRCFYYDGRRQIVRLYDVNATGHIVADLVKNEVAWREYRGRVKLTYRREAA